MPQRNNDHIKSPVGEMADGKKGQHGNIQYPVSFSSGWPIYFAALFYGQNSNGWSLVKNKNIH